MRKKRQIPIKVRKEVLEKYNNRCIKCGSIKKLHLHHIFMESEGGEETVDNLVPLCKKCHEDFHKYYCFDVYLCENNNPQEHKRVFETFLKIPHSKAIIRTLRALFNNEDFGVETLKEMTAWHFLEMINTLYNSRIEMENKKMLEDE